MKTKNTTSKHDIIRSIKSLRVRMDRLYSILLIQQQEVKEYIEFMGNEKEYEAHLKKKYEREQPKDDGSGGDSKSSEK